MHTIDFSRRRLLGLSVLPLGAAMAGTVRADDDHERARQALAQGQVLPLASVLAGLEQQGYAGHVLKVEFEREQGRYLYEIRLLLGDGRAVKLEVDATDGKVLRARQKGRH